MYVFLLCVWKANFLKSSHILYKRKFSQYEILLLGKQIGFSQLYFCGSPSHNFMIFCISVVTWQCQMAIYATYLITLRTEGQVLCLAKHHSTEHRELVHDHPSCDWSFKCVLQWKLEFPQRPCGRPSLHHLKYCAYVKIA